MNRWLLRVILLEVGWAAGVLVFVLCRIDEPWDVMLWLEKNVLLPRHIGITQATWNTCIWVMKTLPMAAGSVAFLLALLLARRILKGLGLIPATGHNAAEMVKTRYERIANRGGFCVAALMFLSISGSMWAAPLIGMGRFEAWHWLPWPYRRTSRSTRSPLALKRTKF